MYPSWFDYWLDTRRRHKAGDFAGSTWHHWTMTWMNISDLGNCMTRPVLTSIIEPFITHQKSLHDHELCWPSLKTWSLLGMSDLDLWHVGSNRIVLDSCLAYLSLTCHVAGISGLLYIVVVSSHVLTTFLSLPILAHLLPFWFQTSMTCDVDHVAVLAINSSR